MENKTLGMTIAALRKERGMTQLDLAKKMGVTDKAVSKWERDLSCPDINSLPILAEILGVSVNELVQAKAGKVRQTIKGDSILSLVLKAVPLAMGAGVVVLSALKQLDIASGFSLLGIGVFCLSLRQFQNEN